MNEISQKTVMPKVIFTIVSSNYLYYARTLMRSVAALHPECERVCVLVDTDVSHAAAFSSEFTVVRLEQLALPERRKFLFRYTILELNTAVKPWAFEYLLSQGYSDVVYIDPDIRLYAPLTEVFALLDEGSDIVVTPHLLAPMTDDKHPSELDIRRCGTYNFGFCAVSSRPQTQDFLHWWQGKLVEDCIVDLDRGIFVDQSWIDLVPGLFANVAILRHPGYNVAYWNLAQRRVESNGGTWTVNDAPLIFFHFSGFDAEKPAAFSKHQNRFTLEASGNVRELALGYAEELLANGARTLRTIPYGYGVFADGVTAIPDLFRRAYRSDDALAASLGDDPFAHPSVLWRMVSASRPGHLAITVAMKCLRDERFDIRNAFSLVDDDSVLRFYEWFAEGGQREFSATVVEAHVDILMSLQAMLYVRKRLDEPQPEPLIVDRLAGEKAFVNRLYLSVLDRPAEVAARERYAARIADRGTTRTFLAIGLSRESRSRPAWLRRFGTGARQAIGWWAQGGGEAATEPVNPQHGVAEEIVTTPTRHRLILPRGWFVSDADVSQSGIWTGPDAALPCGSPNGEVLEIEGFYFAELVERQTGSPECRFSMHVGDRLVAETTLASSGHFSFRTTLPDDLGPGLVELRICCSAHFVPRTIGLNDDRRQLAWRALRVVVGQELLLEATRDPPILSIDAIAKVEGVNLIGYLAAESGVGESVRSFAKGCRAVGLRYGAIDVGYQNLNRQSDQSMRDSQIEDRVFPINIIHVNADQTGATLQALPPVYREAGATIAYWHWEQPELPLSALEAFEGLSEVWVPSGFVRDAVAGLSPVPVFKVPHVIEFAVPTGDVRARFGLPADKFLVLMMYDFDSYQYRKNPHAAIAAYRQACGARGDSALVVKTINAERHPEGRQELLDAVADLDSAIFIDRYLDRAEVHALEEACDCFISLHRSEGFGLGLAEMMYLGKPVLGTDWSGNTEFMTSMNSFPIRYELKPLARRLGVYEAGQPWAEADVDHASHELRRLMDDDHLRESVGRAAHAYMRRYLSGVRIGTIYRKRLALLQSRLA